MQVKLIEIRDRMTFIPALAVRLLVDDATSQEYWLLRRAGYMGALISHPSESAYVVLVKLVDSTAHNDPYDWGNRTMSTAHQHLIAHWDTYKTGDVLDVEFVLGEVNAPKKTERDTTTRLM